MFLMAICLVNYPWKTLDQNDFALIKCPYVDKNAFSQFKGYFGNDKMFMVSVKNLSLEFQFRDYQAL